LLKSSGK